jgi:hypothetical protein
MKRNNRFQPGVSGNPVTQWRPGQSGNPVGKTKRRADFEESFNEALITEGSPHEAAKLLWAAARSGEPWALQEICRRFAPETQSLRLTHEEENERFDYTKLTDQQIQQLDAILADAEPAPAGSREGAPQLL